jgi:hypothetical protein
LRKESCALLCSDTLLPQYFEGSIRKPLSGVAIDPVEAWSALLFYNMHL